MTAQGYTIFHIACLQGYIEIVHLLIKRGVDYNIVDNNGISAFFISCQKGHVQIVELLISIGVDMKALTKQGYSNIYIASYFGRIDVVLLFIKYNINIYEKFKGKTMVDIYGIGNDDTHLKPEDIERHKYLMVTEYRKENNWLRRKDFVIFLKTSNFIETNDKASIPYLTSSIDLLKIDTNTFGNSNHLSPVSLPEKVFSLRPMYETIASFL